MNLRRIGVWAALLLTILSMTAAAQSRSAQRRLTGVIDDGVLSKLGRSVHPLAQARYEVGSVDDSLTMKNMILVLKRSSEQQEALDQLLVEQQTPGSPNYHKWLTPTEFGERFSPSESDVATVKDWLASHGFTVERVAAGGGVLLFSGTAGAVRNAFHTEMRSYQVRGRQYMANASAVELPTALTNVVQGVVSLNNFGRQHYLHPAPNEGRAPNYYIGLGSYNNGFGPGDFATIYNSASLLTKSSPITGAGVSIAVLGRSNIDITDVAEFRAMFGLPANKPNVILTGDDPGLVEGDEGESALDVQWAGATAPGATINFVTTNSTVSSDGVDLSAIYAVENMSGDIISFSYGNCESTMGDAGNAMFEYLWAQAAAEGITVLVSTGDNGSAGCDSQGSENYATGGLAINGLASTPYNVAVGGTDFNYGANGASTYWGTSNSSLYSGSALGYIPEAVWNDTCVGSAGSYSTALSNCSAGNTDDSGDGLGLWAGSGGASSYYSKPSWQSGSGVPNDSKRDIPDVSLLSGGAQSHVYYIVCQKDANGVSGTSCNMDCTRSGDYCYFNFHRVSGTSASTPAMAGVLALVAQSVGGRLGLVNRNLYSLASKSHGSSIYNDVTTGSNAVPCKGGTTNCSSSSSSTPGVLISGSQTLGYAAGAGYDLATGLGTVNVGNMVSYWGDATYAATTTTLNAPQSTSITHGSTQTLSVSVSGASGTPTGVVSLYAVYGDGTKLSVDVADLSSGAASFKDEMLPGGNYTLYARYSGDASYATSVSNGVAMTVAKESSKVWPEILIGRRTTATSVTYGGSYVMRADVTNASGAAYSASNTAPCNLLGYCATGSLAILDNGSPLGTFSLNSLGYVEYDSIQAALTAGSHTLTANYSGDNSYASSTGSVNLTVSQAATTTAIASSPSTAATGSSITLSAKINTVSAGAAPTGAVVFQYALSGSSTPSTFTGSATYDRYAYDATTGTEAYTVATLTTTAPSSAGSYAITASYAGDGNYVASASAAATMSVTGSTVHVTPTVSASSITSYRGGDNGSLTLTLTPINGYTGVVNLSCGLSSTAGMTCSLPSSVTIVNASTPVTATVTLSAAAAASLGNVTVTITAATPDGGSSSASFTDTVVAPYPSIAGGSATVIAAAGGSASGTFTITSVGGYAGASSLSCSTDTSAITCSVSPSSPTLGGSPVSVAYNAVTTAAASLGSHVITIKDSVSGASGYGYLTVAAPVYMQNQGTPSLAIGAPGTINFSVTPQHGFTGSVTFSCVSSSAANLGCTAPSDASSLASGAVNVPFALTAAPSATPGVYPVTVTGTTSTGFVATAAGSVRIYAPYAVDYSASALTLAPGASGSTTLTLTPAMATAGSVSVSCATSNANITCSPASASISTASGAGVTDVITISTAAATPSGSYTVTVKTNGLSMMLTQAITVTVPAPFSMSGSSVTMNSGSSTTMAISLTPVNSNYTGTVALACTPSSSAITCSFDKTSYSLSGGVAATATMTVTASSTAQNRPASGMPWRTGGGLLLCGVLAALPLRRRLRLTLLALGVAALLAMSGCGGGSGGSSGSKTTYNNYTVAVTATASTGQTSTSTYSVTVATTTTK